MVKVITYGTYDLFHYGHQRLLERAKALGDYLIVGVTSDSFDLTRGKINAQQSLMERIESVRASGLADEIMVSTDDQAIADKEINALAERIMRRVRHKRQRIHRDQRPVQEKLAEAVEARLRKHRERPDGECLKP